jgi:hypothetical protein
LNIVPAVFVFMVTVVVQVAAGGQVCSDIQGAITVPQSVHFHPMAIGGRLAAGSGHVGMLLFQVYGHVYEEVPVQ